MSAGSLRALDAACARRREDTAWRLAEVAWLIEGGVWPATACARVGWTLTAAAGAARRHRHPLATVLESKASAA